MSKTLRCMLGFHKWSRATFIDHSTHSAILDWKQNCEKCGKRITWVQPKGLNEKFYPIYWTKRSDLIILIIVIVIFYLIYKYIV